MKKIIFYLFLSLFLFNLSEVYGHFSSIMVGYNEPISDKKNTSVWSKYPMMINDSLVFCNQSNDKNPNCCDVILFNYNDQQNCNIFLPYKERVKDTIIEDVFVEGIPVLYFPPTISILKNDTVFHYEYFISTDTIIDSIGFASYTIKIKTSLKNYSVKIEGREYLQIFRDGEYRIERYNKQRKLSSHEKLIVNSIGGKVVEQSYELRYNKDGLLIDKWILVLDYFYFYYLCPIKNKYKKYTLKKAL